MSAGRTTRSVRSSAAALALLSAAAFAQTMTRLSVDTTWHPGNATSCASYSTTMPMSGDGYALVPWLLAGAAASERWVDLALGAALAALSIPRGSIRERHGSWGRRII
jgi:hypothetical protein